MGYITRGTNCGKWKMADGTIVDVKPPVNMLDGRSSMQEQVDKIASKAIVARDAESAKRRMLKNMRLSKLRGGS